MGDPQKNRSRVVHEVAATRPLLTLFKRAEPEMGQRAATASSVAVRVFFDGSEHPVPVDRPDQIDDMIGAIHLGNGWFALESIRSSLVLRVASGERADSALSDLRALKPADAAIARGAATNAAFLAEQSAAHGAWSAGMARFAPAVYRALTRVETTAKAIAVERLNETKADVRATANHYLTGFDDRILEGDTLTFPQSTTLARNAAVDSLRASLRTMASAEVETPSERLNGTLVRVLGAISPAAALASVALQARKAVMAALRRAALRDRLAAQHPVVYRIDPPVSGPDQSLNDEDIKDAIVAALERVYAAQAVVRSRSEVSMLAAADENHASGPSIALGGRLRDRGLKGAGGFLARLRGEKCGPWEYQTLIESAVHDIAGPGPSLTRWATHDTYRSAAPELAGSFAECGATAGALLALHLTAPPLALAADIALAVKGIAEALADHDKDSDAYWCALNPADSFGMEPGLVRLALRCAGEIAGVIPGSRIAVGFSLVAPLAAEAAQ